uniref:Uncharacterized protein n=1 Tax=Ciona intestinalis TaxID=7719 RepID=H2XYG5_CIOIN
MGRRSQKLPLVVQMKPRASEGSRLVSNILPGVSQWKVVSSYLSLEVISWSGI